MDKRFKEISSRLREYSLGKFDKTLSISPDLDEFDAISTGINMLGEELKAITISRDYFNNIFNSVSDMVFVLTYKGIIEDANRSAEKQLIYESGGLKGKLFDSLHRGNFSCFNYISRQLKQSTPLRTNDTILETSDGDIIQVRINAGYFKEGQKRRLILLTASDITYQIKTENLIIRAIIDTQEKERHRLAQDLHDSLAQQLSAIKFYISTTAEMVKNKQQKANLLKSNEALTEVITDMRDICFNLMPKTLEEFGLIKAVREYCNKLSDNNKIHFSIEEGRKLPIFFPELEIDLYRVIQEFITNAIRHGSATKISIFFNFQKSILKITMTDNGSGFDSAVPVNGMGLQNVRSRVRSHNGLLDMVSGIGKGTCYKIIIPLNT